MKKPLLLGLGAVAMAFAAGAICSFGTTLSSSQTNEVLAASSSTVFRGQSGDVLYVKAKKATYFPSGYDCTVHLWGGNSEIVSDNDIYVTNSGSYAAYTEGEYSYIPLRVPFDSEDNSVTYTMMQICRKVVASGEYDDNYTENISISDLTSRPTNLISYTNWRTYEITDGTYTHYGIKSGTHIYLNLQDAGENWASAEAKYAINFWASDTFGGAAWTQTFNADHTSCSDSFMWKVEGQGDAFEGELYEAIVPQLNGVDVIWNGLKAYRFDTIAEVGDLSTTSGKIWNSGNEHYFNGSISSRNVIQKGAGDKNWWGDTQIEIQISDSDRAEMYGSYFLSQVTCDDSGSITGKAGYWANVTNEYNQHLSDGVHDIVFNEEGVKSGGTDLQTAVYRYDYIVLYKKPLDETTYAVNTDFINRADSPYKTTIFGARNIPFSLVGNEMKGETVAVILVSAIAVASITTYLFFNRKKER